LPIQQEADHAHLSRRTARCVGTAAATRRSGGLGEDLVDGLSGRPGGVGYGRLPGPQRLEGGVHQLEDLVRAGVVRGVERPGWPNTFTVVLKMGCSASNRGSFQTSERAPGLPPPPKTCSTPDSLSVMNFAHSQAASGALDSLVNAYPVMVPCVPRWPAGPLGSRVAFHRNASS
jgi:hypothetical protein